MTILQLDKEMKSSGFYELISQAAYLEKKSNPGFCKNGEAPDLHQRIGQKLTNILQRVKNSRFNKDAHRAKTLDMINTLKARRQFVKDQNESINQSHDSFFRQNLYESSETQNNNGTESPFYFEKANKTRANTNLSAYQ